LDAQHKKTEGASPTSWEKGTSKKNEDTYRKEEVAGAEKGLFRINGQKREKKTPTVWCGGGV